MAATDTKLGCTDEALRANTAILYCSVRCFGMGLEFVSACDWLVDNPEV